MVTRSMGLESAGYGMREGQDAYSPGGVAGIKGRGDLATTIEQGRWANQGLQTQGVNSLADIRAKGVEDRAGSEAKWKRMMEFMQGQTFNNLMGMGGQGGGAYGEQFAANRAYPAIRNYQNEKREVANRMGSRGMSLGVSNDNAYGNAYGNLSRSLAEAGTAGDVATKQLQQGMLAQLLQFAGQGMSGGF